MSYPFISPFLRDNDRQVHLPAATYILRRVQVQFGWLKSGWDQVWVGSGCQPSAKAPAEFCGGKRVFFTWSRSVPVLCPILLSPESDTCVVCTYGYVDVLTKVRIMVE